MDCQIHLTGPVLICQSQDTSSSNVFGTMVRCSKVFADRTRRIYKDQATVEGVHWTSGFRLSL